MTDSYGRLNRRSFLKRTAALGASLALPAIVPARALGRGGAVAPSNRIVMGCIGVGGQGTGNLKNFLGHAEVQMVAVCDVDRDHLQSAQKIVDARYEGKACAGIADFRELAARPDIDAVMVATPDHWHTQASLECLRHGKDVYCEKPLTLTVQEGIVLRDEARRLGRILQTGSQQRSADNFRFACELVRNGRIGTVLKVMVGIPGNNKFNTAWQPEPVPEVLDYDLWLGQAPAEPYTHDRCHYTFRFIRDYSGGQVTNWGAHHIDIGQWGLGMDDSGPVEISGKGGYPQDGLFNTASKVYFECTYANGTVLICQTRGSEDDQAARTPEGRFSSGTTFIGDKGWVYVNRGQLKTEPERLLREKIGAAEINLIRSRDHHGNFLECVRTRRPSICDVAIGHRSASVCHLGNIAMLLGRKFRWDPAAEKVVGDDAAARLCSRAMRTPWRLV